MEVKFNLYLTWYVFYHLLKKCLCPKQIFLGGLAISFESVSTKFSKQFH